MEGGKGTGDGGEGGGRIFGVFSNFIKLHSRTNHEPAVKKIAQKNIIKERWKDLRRVSE